jgi:hypothetical protein
LFSPKPSFCSLRHRAVVGVLNGELEKDLVGWPARFASAEDVRVLAKE